MYTQDPVRIGTGIGRRSTQVDIHPTRPLEATMMINPTTGSESSLMSNSTFWMGAFMTLGIGVMPSAAQEPQETLQQRVERLEKLVAELSQQLKVSDRKAEVR